MRAQCRQGSAVWRRWEDLGGVRWKVYNKEPIILYTPFAIEKSTEQSKHQKSQLSWDLSPWQFTLRGIQIQISICYSVWELHLSSSLFDIAVIPVLKDIQAWGSHTTGRGIKARQGSASHQLTMRAQWVEYHTRQPHYWQLCQRDTEHQQEPWPTFPLHSHTSERYYFGFGHVWVKNVACMMNNLALH